MKAMKLALAGRDILLKYRFLLKKKHLSIKVINLLF